MSVDLVALAVQMMSEHGEKVATIAAYKLLSVMGDVLRERIANNHNDDGMQILYGDNFKKCGIIPGNTNKFLLERGEYRSSRYVNYAFERVAKHHHYLCGSPKFQFVDHNDQDMYLEKQKNLLILGGPVANQYTKGICGYTDISVYADPEKKVPVFQHASSLLEYGFYCGDENGWSTWGGKPVTVSRRNESGALVEMAKYGLKDRSGKIIEPPMEGNRLAGDMLMIIRVPNASSAGGVHTIIGGMHGYSLEAFFTEFKSNMTELAKTVGSTEYFQLLVPVKINADGSTKVEWNGWANWRPAFVPLRSETFK